MRSPSIGSRTRASRSRPELDGAALLARRRASFRHEASLRVRSAATALSFVNAVGLCSTFYVFREGLPSLWEAVVGRSSPRWPRRSHHDAAIGLTWELKDVLPGRRQVYYGKLVKGRPVLVALDLFPAFYALVRGSQRSRDYVHEYEAGRMSQTTKRIMDSLMRESPQYTRGLRADCFMLEPSRTRAFERAMAELQQGLWIVKTEERYEPSFSYRWDLVERWLPGPTADGRRLRRPAALDALLTRYVGTVIYTTPQTVSRLFAVPRADVMASVARLERAAVVRQVEDLPGLPGRWLVWGQILTS